MPYCLWILNILHNCKEPAYAFIYWDSPRTLVSKKNKVISRPSSPGFYSVILLSDECVLRSLDAVVHSKSSWVIQAKAGLHIIWEVTVESV